jgi:squalene-hopene/tetraprenyl-beta-curcumene cyclase
MNNLSNFLLIMGTATLQCIAEPEVTLENHTRPTSNVASEPIIKKFDYEKAVRFTDNAAMAWQKSRSCVTCHTNGLYLVTRPAAGVDAPAYKEARLFTKKYLLQNISLSAKPKKKRGIEGIVASTAFLAISDIKVNRKLGETTKQAFDYAWSKQDKSGAWTGWLKCNWGPYESDDHFGVTLVALAAGMSSDDPYFETEKAREGLRKIKTYLAKSPPESLHQMGMMLWASAHFSALASKDQITQWRKDLFAAQKKDGGWVLIELGNDAWKREDNKPQSKETDGYATAFAIHVLTESGVDKSDPRLVKARQWLKSQQRESGRWYTRSPRREKKHYISHAATNFALLALVDDNGK